MALARGARIGVYEVVTLIGAGGMGEVYRARDPELGREVAIKILPDVFSADAERVARFQREAQVLASLNHPNIAQIYGLERIGEARALILELVDGPTLADRIAQGPIPLDEALKIARQIADALEAAHEQAIIHRDLKPANIKLTADGSVKVLDFGLAKLAEPAGARYQSGSSAVSQSPTITSPAMTQMGVILGTAAYMSPEQTKGRAADKRSDVWAFGCVLYEMVTGKRAFEGEDVSDTLASVLKTDPDWNALPADLPAAIHTLIRRCLAKDRRQRIADVSVAQFILGDTASVAPAYGAAMPVVPRRPWKLTLAFVAGALLLSTFAGVAAWLLKPSMPSSPVARFSLAFSAGQQPTMVTRHVVAISPDGTRLAYIANQRVFLRPLGDFDGHAIPGTEEDRGVASPSFSPDGQSIAFYSQRDQALKRIAVSGGAAVTICPSPAPFGMTWDPSGVVIGLGSSGIVRCSPNGGAPEQLATVAADELAHGPQLLLDGAALLFTIGKVGDGVTRWDKAQIVVQTMKTGARKTIVNGGTDARYVSSGHLVYAHGGVVFAVPFDPARQALIGSAVPVVEGVRRASPSTTGAVQFAISRSGTLLYVPGPTGTATTERALAVADRAGALSRLPIPAGPYMHVRASRNGASLAIGVDDGKEAWVSIQDLTAESTMRRLTFGGQNRYPIWSHDGQRVAFQSDREGDMGIFSQRSDGSGPVERLTRAAKGEVHVPESWSPDGRHVSYSLVKNSAFSLWMLSTVDKKATPFGGVESIEPISSVFSPNGRWIAYGSTPVGASSGALVASRGVYIQPFPATGDRYQLPKQTIDFHPTWGPKGTELFFIPSAASGQLAAVSVATEPSVTFGSPASLPARVTVNRLSSEMRAYDILPDGKFVGLVSASEADSPESGLNSQMRVVLNWFEELKQRVPTK